jgi:acetyl-CoA carboxylase biotin carboxyl carrier protein
MDEKTILTIMDKFNSSSMVELELNESNAGLKLRKAGAFSRSTGSGSAAPGGSQTSTPEGGGSQNSGPENGGQTAAGQTEGSGVRLGLPGAVVEGEFITSPIVATFYAASGPGAKPFVSSGSKIKAGETLCMLEAMKMMNHLEAEFDCEILEVKAKNGDLVE